MSRSEPSRTRAGRHRDGPARHRIEAGIATYGQKDGSVPVEVEYRSFEPAPDTPVDFDRSEVDFLVRHRGLSQDQVRSMLDRVTRIGAGEGLHDDFDALRHTNTVKAHQLLHHARDRGLQAQAKERLLGTDFVEGRHVGRAEDLAALASEIGLDGDDAQRSLAGDEYLDAVPADERAAMDYGIQGVPFFVIDGRYGVSGARSAAVLVEALSQVAAERRVAVR